jgi:hypothetical protein
VRTYGRNVLFWYIYLHAISIDVRVRIHTVACEGIKGKKGDKTYGAVHLVTTKM